MSGGSVIITPTGITSSVAGTYSSHADYLIDGTEFDPPPDMSTYDGLKASCFLDTDNGDQMWLTGGNGLSQVPALTLLLDGYYQVTDVVIWPYCYSEWNGPLGAGPHSATNFTAAFSVDGGAFFDNDAVLTIPKDSTMLTPTSLRVNGGAPCRQESAP